jgi:hypothetical protein
MRRYDTSRRELFEQVERQHLLPLPSERFSFCELARVTVNIDYHVAFDFHFYSVPNQLRYETEPVVELRVTSTTIEVLFKNRRITSHARSYTGLQDGRRHPLTCLVEAADNIAYVTGDIEGVLKKGLVDYATIFSTLEEVESAESKERIKKYLAEIYKEYRGWYARIRRGRAPSSGSKQPRMYLSRSLTNCDSRDGRRASLGAVMAPPPIHGPRGGRSGSVDKRPRKSSTLVKANFPKHCTVLLAARPSSTPKEPHQ